MQIDEIPLIVHASVDYKSFQSLMDFVRLHKIAWHLISKLFTVINTNHVAMETRYAHLTRVAVETKYAYPTRVAMEIRYAHPTRVAMETRFAHPTHVKMLWDGLPASCGTGI